MIQELDRVILKIDLPEYGLEQGDIGTVVMVHQNGAGYEVEFVTLNGDTVAVVSLYNKQIHPISTKDAKRSFIKKK